MAVSVPLSIESNLMFYGSRLRIDDLDNNIPSDTDFLETNVALIWPYSSSTQRLSFLLTEEAPLARKIKSQLKVTFHGPCANEVAYIKVGIGDRVKLSLNEVSIADSRDTLSTPGKKSHIELHFSHSVQLQVYSAAKSVRHVKFVAPAEIPISPTRRSVNGDIDVEKSTSIQISSTPLPFKTDSYLSSSSFAESFIGPFTRQLDESDTHRNKRTKFARHSGAWRLTDEDDEPVNGQLLRQDSLIDNGPHNPQTRTVTEPAFQQSGREQPQSEAPYPIILDPGPASLQHDPDPISPMLPSDTSKSFMTTVELEISAESSKPSNETILAETSHDLQSSPSRKISTPRLEAIPSSALSLISPLVQRSQHPRPLSEYTSELEASADSVDIIGGKKSPSLLIDLVESATASSKPNFSSDAIDILDHISDRPDPVPTDTNPKFVDLDLLEHQVDLEHTTRHEAVTKPLVEEDENMYSPHLQTRPYVQQELPLTANNLVVLRNESESVTYISQVSSTLTSVSNHAGFFDEDKSEGMSNAQATLALTNSPQQKGMSMLYAYEADEQLKAPNPPPDHADNLASTVKEVVEFDQVVDKSDGPLVRQLYPELGTDPNVSTTNEDIGSTALEPGESTQTIDEADPALQYGNDGVYRTMTPPATQPALGQLDNPRQPTTTTVIPPTPSDSQKQTQHQIGFDGVADSETENAKLAFPKQVLSRTLPLHLEAHPSLPVLPELQFLEGLSSDYFTPSKQTPGTVEDRFADGTVVTSSDDPLNEAGLAEVKSDMVSQNRQPSQTLEGSTSTSTSYYPLLNTLLEHYGQMVDIIAVCTADSTTPQRAQTGPKHFHTTLHVVDASEQVYNSVSLSVPIQLFRYKQDALPNPKRGDIVLLRNLKVQIRSHRPLLVSSDESAWAVFSFDDLSNSHVVTAGPPIEFGGSEEDKACLLREWWLETGVTRYPDRPTVESNGAQESTATPRQAFKKQPVLHIDLRRSPRQTRITNYSQSQFEIPGDHEGLDSSSPRQELQSPSSRAQLSRHSMQPPNTPSWSAISPTSNEGLNSVPPTPSSHRAKLHLSPQSPQSDLMNADTGSIISTPSIATTNTSRRRSVRRSTSLVHELRDGTQYIDIEEEEVGSVSGSDGESAAAEEQEDKTDGLEAHRSSRRLKEKPRVNTNAKKEGDVGSSITATTPSKARPRRHRGSFAQTSATQATSAIAAPDSANSGVSIGNNPRLTRSKAKAGKSS